MNGLGQLLDSKAAPAPHTTACLRCCSKATGDSAGRVKRPPTDPVNALLSFGYTVLTNQIVSLAHAVGLDPGLGVLHQPGFGKPAPGARPDRGIPPDHRRFSGRSRMINIGQITVSDFTEEVGAYRLHDQARKAFVES